MNCPKTRLMIPKSTTNLARVVVRPLFMSKPEFTQVIHQVCLDVASDRIVRLANGLAVVDNVGLVGALEILMRLGILFSVLDIPRPESLGTER